MKEKRNKRQKIHLIFDEKERTEFLTGFRKRKLERKMKVKEDLAEMLKKEKKKIKQSQKETIRNTILSQRQVPEVQHLLEPVTYDLPDHTVTIKEVDDMNSVPASSTLTDAAIMPFSAKSEEEVEKLRKVIKELKEKRMKTLKKSTVQSAAKKLQKKSDRQKARRRKKQYLIGL
ncbi:Nucleolar protein 12, partial [Stegodyphus mimosarum]